MTGVAKILVVIGVAALSPAAWALLPQTQQDLRVLQDRLTYELKSEKNGIADPIVTPILVATPQAYWDESKADFAPAVTEVLGRVFPQRGDLIPCAECFENRVFVSRDNRMVIQNGELGLSDLARLRTNKSFAGAKSLLVISETPAGISVQLRSLDDGRLLVAGMMDATRTLNEAEPPLRLARELDRRERGEGLTYVMMDLGVYPSGLVQLQWLEQWGSRNQHLSGFALSAVNPDGGLGGVYRYMLPTKRQCTIGLVGYYSIKSLFSKPSDTDAPPRFIGQASVNYAISGSYGVFAAADTTGNFTMGFSLLNLVFLPFLF